MDIKIQPPKKDASREELLSWCNRLAEELNLVFEELEYRITEMKRGKK